MGVTITYAYECDACGAAIDAERVLYAVLPYARTVHVGVLTFTNRGGKMINPHPPGYFCSYDCLRAKLDELASSAA